MNLYLIALFLLAAGSLAERKYPEYEKRLYQFCWLVLTALLCLRFGQGTDYVTYHAIYDTIPATVDLQHGYICGYYPEIGWRLVSAAFKLLHIPFQGFAFVLGLADMAKALRTGRSMRAGCEQTLHVLEIMTAFERSSREGRFVNLETAYERKAPMNNECITGVLDS